MHRSLFPDASIFLFVTVTISQSNKKKEIPDENLISMIFDDSKMFTWKRIELMYLMQYICFLDKGESTYFSTKLYAIGFGNKGHLL